MIPYVYSTLLRPDFVPKSRSAQGQVGDLAAGSTEIDSHRGGGLWKQARPGHSGKGVRFKTIRGTIFVQPKVYPRKIPQLERSVGGKAELLNTDGQSLIEACREDLATHPGRVFALVVENLVAGDDFPYRQRAFPEGRNHPRSIGAPM